MLHHYRQQTHIAPQPIKINQQVQSQKGIHIFNSLKYSIKKTRCILVTTGFIINLSFTTQPLCSGYCIHLPSERS